MSWTTEIATKTEEITPQLQIEPLVFQSLNLSPKQGLMLDWVAQNAGQIFTKATMSDVLVEPAWERRTAQADELIKKVRKSSLQERLLINATTGYNYYCFVPLEADVDEVRIYLDTSVDAGVGSSKLPQIPTVPSWYKGTPQQVVPSEDEAWAEYAGCNGINQELLYPRAGSSTLPAKFICSRCTVMDFCLQEGLEDIRGVAGGLSATERSEIRQMRNQSETEAAIDLRIKSLRTAGFVAANAAYRGRGFSWPGDAISPVA